MEIKEDNQTLAFKKLSELRKRLYFEGGATRDPKILLLAQELGEIEKMLMEERKQNQTPSTMAMRELSKGGIVTHNTDDLDRGHEDSVAIR